jgi:hypothetical protein
MTILLVQAFSQLPLEALHPVALIALSICALALLYAEIRVASAFAAASG